MSITDEGHYGPKQLNLLKTVWGEGFLSPGGTDEIDEVMKGIDASGKTVLDIGCGCGGAAIHLIKNHGAKSVLGIDTESLVIQRAEELTEKYDLSSLAHFRCVKPGPLDVPDESVDLVFSKEVFLHISDKDDLLKRHLSSTTSPVAWLLQVIGCESMIILLRCKCRSISRPRGLICICVHLSVMSKY